MTKVGFGRLTVIVPGWQEEEDFLPLLQEDFPSKKENLMTDGYWSWDHPQSQCVRPCFSRGSAALQGHGFTLILEGTTLPDCRIHGGFEQWPHHLNSRSIAVLLGLRVTAIECGPCSSAWLMVSNWGMYIHDILICLKSYYYAVQICVSFFFSLQSISCESVTVNKTTSKNAFTLILPT